jgi:membrane-associated phospholipid phosphatase
MEFELEIIRWLQSFANGFWTAFFSFWTMFGEETIIIGLMGFIYWCHDKKTGEFLGLTLFLSQIVNSVVKISIQRPRPFEVDGAIVNLRDSTSSGYSFPSGHTQGAASVFGFVAFWLKKRWVTVVTIFIIVMVALSRMYLGVHYLTDVVAGGLLGLGIVYGLYRWQPHIKNTEKWYNLLLIVTGGILVVMTVISVFTVQAREGWSDAYTFYDKLEGLFKMSGAFLGFALGLRYEKAKVGFDNHRILWKNLLRLAIGIGVVMAIRLGLKAVFQLIVETDEAATLGSGEFLKAAIALLLDGIRYAVMVFAGLGLVPLVFKKIHL